MNSREVFDFEAAKTCATTFPTANGDEHLWRIAWYFGHAGLKSLIMTLRYSLSDDPASQ